jgi:hypothetical protein
VSFNRAYRCSCSNSRRVTIVAGAEKFSQSSPRGARRERIRLSIPQRCIIIIRARFLRITLSSCLHNKRRDDATAADVHNEMTFFRGETLQSGYPRVTSGSHCLWFYGTFQIRRFYCFSFCLPVSNRVRKPTIFRLDRLSTLTNRRAFNETMMSVATKNTQMRNRCR